MVVTVYILYLYAFLMHFAEYTLVKYVYQSSLCNNFRELILMHKWLPHTEIFNKTFVQQIVDLSSRTTMTI